MSITGRGGEGGGGTNSETVLPGLTNIECKVCDGSAKKLLKALLKR